MSTTTDAVIVGGGHNGLVCAAYLARAGVRTVIVEARESLGGCASTVDAVGGRVNICNCDHLAVRSLPLADELDLAGHGLRYLDVEPAMGAMTWEHRTPWFAHHDVERTLEGLARSHPDQVDGYRRYVADAAPLGRLVLEAASRPPHVGGLALTTLRRHRRAAARLLAWSRRSAADVLADYLSPDFFGPMLAAGPVVWGVSPLMRGTGAGAIAPVMKHLVRLGRPVGGSGGLITALEAAYVAAGGEVVTDAAVARIRCEGDRVRGIVTHDGREIDAATVIVACDPRRAFVEWLSGAPAGARSFVQRWASAPERDGYESKIDALVDRLPRYLDVDGAAFDGDTDHPLAPTMTIAPHPDRIDAARRRADAGGVADDPVMLCNLPTVVDPSMAPAGKHVFSLEVLYTPYAVEGGWPGSHEPRRWLERYATLVEPGFLDGIESWRVMTPDRYEGEFFMPRGYATSFAGGPVAALLGRSQPELSRYRTPIDGLYVTGAAAFPGAGVWGAPGRNAAQVVLRDTDRDVEMATAEISLPAMPRA